MEYIFNESLFDGSVEALSILCWLLPSIAAVLLWNRKRSFPQKAVIWFSFGAFALEYFSSNRDLTEAVSNGTNSPFYHVGTVLLFWLLGRIYYASFSKIWQQRWRRYVLPGFTLFALVNAVWLDGFMNFPSLSIGLYSFTGILLPLLFMLTTLRTLAIPRLDKDPLFIAASGLLIYYSGNFLLWLFLSYINFDYEFFLSIYRVNSVLTILLNLFLMYAVIVPVSLQPKSLNP